MIKKIIKATTFLTIICILCFLIKSPDTLVDVKDKTYASAGQTIKNESDVKSTTQLSVEMYRLYNPNSGEHFYTASADERDTLISAGWKYEGVGWIAPATSNTPVFRLYNPNAGEHHYTMNREERDYLVTIGWKDEGIGWYSDDAKTVALYRQYNPNAKTGSHNYTTSKSENDWLVSIGWKGEGIGWYGLSEQSDAHTPSHTHTWATRTVTDTNGWDEQVLVKDAWDETVVVKEAWDEQIPILEGKEHKVTNAGTDLTGWTWEQRDQYCREHNCSCSGGTNSGDCVCGGWCTVWIDEVVGYTTEHHDAETKVVHHDAEYKTVHHDATTHTETYCTECGAVK
ncbi:MAG: hypothetical protein IJV15_08860 [Lachnospiraceae bacterium]|nr:hypothetical protein [Lachnospiraceae bacterium]